MEKAWIGVNGVRAEEDDEGASAQGTRVSTSESPQKGEMECFRHMRKQGTNETILNN